MTKLKNNFSISLILLSVLLFVCSLFAFNIDNINVVNADSVNVSFSGSSVYTPMTSRTYGIDFDNFSPEYTSS